MEIILSKFKNHAKNALPDLKSGRAFLAQFRPNIPGLYLIIL